MENTPLEDMAMHAQPAPKKFNSSSLQFYSCIAPSILFPMAMGISDGVNHPIVSQQIRQGVYGGCVFLHLGKYQCPPAYSPASEKLFGGVVVTVASYWLGRGIGTLVDRLF